MIRCFVGALRVWSLVGDRSERIDDLHERLDGVDLVGGAAAAVAQAS